MNRKAWERRGKQGIARAIGRALRVPAESGPPRDLSSFRSILLVRTQNQLGDFLLGTPALRAARAQAPNARIDLLVAPQNAAPALHNARVDEVIVFDKRALGRRPARWRSFAGRLRAARYDLALVLSSVDFSITAVGLAALSGAARRAGRPGERSPEREIARDVFHWVLPAAAPERHQTAAHLDLVREFGAPFDDGRPEMFLSAPERTEGARALDETIGPRGGSLRIVLHPGAGKIPNRWDAARFGEVAKELAAAGHRVAATAGPAERALLDRLDHGAGSRVPRLPALSIRALAGALAHADSSSGERHRGAARGSRGRNPRDRALRPDRPAPLVSRIRPRVHAARSGRRSRTAAGEGGRAGRGRPRAPSRPGLGDSRRAPARTPDHAVSGSLAFRAPNWLGDAVLSTVAIPALRRRHPAARITVLAPRGLGDVFAASPFVDQVVEFDRAGEVDAYRRGGYDRVLLGPGSWGAAWRAFRGGVRERMGFATSGRGWLLARQLPARDDSRARHQVENYRALASLDGAPGVDDVPAVTLRDEWRDEARTLWPEQARTRVAIQPGAAFGPAKRWFPERWAEVAAALAKRGADVALVGGEKDRAVVDAVRAGAPGALDLAGRTRVGVLGAILESADVFLTNDTGPMHLAAACGTPTLAIFGSTNPTWTRPYGEGHRVEQSRTPCSPCYQRDCRFGTPCMEGVSSPRVLRQALEMIEASS